MQNLVKRRVVVLCGYGEFSRRVAAGVVALDQAECVLGLPPGSRATGFSREIGAPFMEIDPNDTSSLRRLLDGAFALVNVHGPFFGREHLAVAERCAERGVHYIDPSDSREYISEFLRLARDAREHGALLVTGASTAPTLSVALTQSLAGEFERVSDIHVFIAPGCGDGRELATARAVIDYARAPQRAKDAGRARRRPSHPLSKTVRFPARFGRRRGHLCDLPDVDVLARQYAPRDITVRTGFAPGFLSFVLTRLAVLCRQGRVERLSPALAALVRFAARTQSDAANSAAVCVTVGGQRHNRQEEHLVCLIGRGGVGPSIAAAPILALLRRWLEQGVGEAGAVSGAGLLHLDDIKPELAAQGVVLVRQ